MQTRGKNSHTDSLELSSARLRHHSPAEVDQPASRARNHFVKTVRFTKIVEESGKPELYTLWVPPEKDRRLQSALKAHRVMTVHQENTGHATDFGEIGFDKDVQGSFLLFPKSLKRYEGSRVVGIKYDLLKETPPMAPVAANKETREPEPEPEPKSAREPAAPPPKFEPLRVFQPETREEPRGRAKPPKPPEAPNESELLSTLTREVGKALKKLEQGNAVAAYNILKESVASK
jgi:hypothetical protein